jgi:hypothetical protein
MGLKLTAGISGSCAVLGGAIGYAYAGIEGATHGSKIGVAAGTRIACLAANNQEKEKTTPQDSKCGAEDKSERKSLRETRNKEFMLVAEKTGLAIQKVCELGGACLKELADTWSKMALTGYAINLGYTNSVIFLDHFENHCQSAFESINCAAIASTHLSTNALLVTCFLCAGFQVYRVATNKGDRNVG